MLSGRGMSGNAAAIRGLRHGRDQGRDGFDLGPEDYAWEAAGVGDCAGGGVGQIVAARRPAYREAVPQACCRRRCRSSLGAVHHHGNQPADGEADGEQDGEGEPEKGARHALGRFGFDAARGQREDGGQGGAGGEAEAGEGMVVQQHGADAGLQGEGDGESGAEFAKEVALGQLHGGEQAGVVRSFRAAAV